MPVNSLKIAWLLASVFCGVSLSPGPGRASSVHSNSQAVHVRGQVRDQCTGKVVEAARIRLLPSTDNVCWRTDQKGKFSFWIAKQELHRIEIEAEGYRKVSLLPAAYLLRDVRLTPEAPSNSSLASISERNTLSIMPASQGVAPAIMSVDSLSELSGRGSSWSPWYHVGVTKVPAGYAVGHVAFWLSGDGACGRSAECRQVPSDDQQVLWEFRLRGHDEVGAPSQTRSVAHIRVYFLPR